MTDPRDAVTVWRCNCCPGIRYRKADDGHWWSTTDVQGVTIHGQTRWALAELDQQHGPLTAVEVADVQTLIDRLATAEATIARIKHLAAQAAEPWTASADVDSDGHVHPRDLTAIPNGGLALVGDTVFSRADRTTPHPDSDWWRLDVTGGPFTLAEILGHDEPPQDRKPRTIEALITADDLNAALKGE